MSTETIPTPHPPKPNVQKVQQRGSVQLCLDSYVERVVAKNSQFIGLFWFCVFFYRSDLTVISTEFDKEKKKRTKKTCLWCVPTSCCCARTRVRKWLPWLPEIRPSWRTVEFFNNCSAWKSSRSRPAITLHRPPSCSRTCVVSSPPGCSRYVLAIPCTYGSFDSANRPIDLVFSTSLDDRPCSDLLRKDFLLAHTPVPLNPYKINLKWCLFKRKWTRVTLWANFLLSLRIQQVTEEQNCEEQVFPLAVNLLDRFLALEASVLQRCQLQLLGCVCLLTASKLRQCRPIGVELLVYYTDYSVTPAQIRVSTFIIFFWANFDSRMCGPTTCAISGLTTQSSGHHFFLLSSTSSWVNEEKRENQLWMGGVEKATCHLTSFARLAKK